MMNAGALRLIAGTMYSMTMFYGRVWQCVGVCEISSCLLGFNAQQVDTRLTPVVAARSPGQWEGLYRAVGADDGSEEPVVASPMHPGEWLLGIAVYTG